MQRNDEAAMLVAANFLFCDFGLLNAGNTRIAGARDLKWFLAPGIHTWLTLHGPSRESRIRGIERNRPNETLRREHHGVSSADHDSCIFVPSGFGRAVLPSSIASIEDIIYCEVSSAVQMVQPGES
jgi:hypothetical protein